MTLTIYGFHDRPHDFAVTKVGASVQKCAFLLDFSRPLERIRWFGVTNRWLGITVGLLIPIVHEGQEKGEHVIWLDRGQPYFADIQKFWREHYGATRSIRSKPADPLEIVTAFVQHFPEDCQ